MAEEILKIEIERETNTRIIKSKELMIKNLIQEIKISGLDLTGIEKEFNDYYVMENEVDKIEKLDKIKNTLESLKSYAYNITVLNFINKNLTLENCDLNDCKYRLYGVLSYFRTSDFITAYSEEETRKLLYEVSYKIIKKELLTSGRSDVLNEILNSDYDTLNINDIVKNEIEEVTKSTIGNVNVLRYLEKIILDKKQEKSIAHYVDKDIILALTYVSASKPDIDLIKERLHDSFKTLENSVKSTNYNLYTKPNNLYEFSNRIVNSNKRKIENLKKAKENLILSIITLSIIIGGSLFEFKRVNEDSKMYNVETTVYDTLKDEVIKTSTIRKLAEDTETLEVYKSELDENGNLVRYHYTYDGEKIRKQLKLDNYDYETVDLTFVKPSKWEVIENTQNDDTERRVLTTQTVNKEEVKGFDEDYNKSTKIFYLIVLLLTTLSVSAITKSGLHVMIKNLIDYLLERKKLNENIENINKDIEGFMNELNNTDDNLNECDNLYKIFESLTEVVDLDTETKEILEYYKKELKNHKDRISEFKEEAETIDKKLKLI